MSSYAFYRLPWQQEYTVLRQQGSPLCLDSYDLLSVQEGFVLAPFSMSADSPLVVIRPEEVWRERLPEGSLESIHPTEEPRLIESSPNASYAETFTLFHEHLLNGRFRKLVLARAEQVPLTVDETIVQRFFLEACVRYPRLFVALVSTPQTGTWLMATPEPLLERLPDGRYHTVALAGTQCMGAGCWPETEVSWRDKEIVEQRYVAEYVSAILSRFADDTMTEGPLTVRAGTLAHLRTDFTFSLRDSSQVGPLLDSLHPTPAVCGLPKEPARRLILSCEPVSRRYYSGFAGPIGLSGATHLYVTLRCMELSDHECTLYAGGGLLSSSHLQQEWEETVAKMQTMRELLRDFV